VLEFVETKVYPLEERLRLRGTLKRTSAVRRETYQKKTTM
jgi:hypothetical protein